MTSSVQSDPRLQSAADRAFYAAAAAPWRARITRRLAAARWLWMSLTVFTVTRLGIALIAYLAVPLVADSTNPPPYHLRGVENLFLDVFSSRWDTGFYLSIVEEGYKLHDVTFPSTPFFPLLPLAMTAVNWVVNDTAVAGLLVTNLALLAATMLFYRLVDLEWGVRVADRAVWYLLIFPAALFGSTIYTESLFLLTTIGALYAARRGRWGVAGALGIAAGLTRLVGVIVVPLLVLEWWAQRRSAASGARPGWRPLIAALAAPLGTLSYIAFLWRRFDDPLAFMTGSAAWGRVPQTPLETLRALLVAPPQGWRAALLAGHIHVNDWLDLLLVLFFLAAGLVLLSQRRWAEAVFVLLGVLIPFSSGLLMSQRRYMWVLFPVFILLARWGERAWVDRLITAVSLLMLALFTAMFANGYWVA